MISAVQSSGKIGNHQWKSPFMWSASSISFSFVRELTRPTYERGRRVETLARTNVRRSRGGSSASSVGWTWILLADDGASSARRYARAHVKAPCARRAARRVRVRRDDRNARRRARLGRRGGAHP